MAEQGINPVIRQRGLIVDKHHHTKIKEAYHHLIGRTMDLFEYGRIREHRLEEALGNCWKTFEVISRQLDDGDLKDLCDTYAKFAHESMSCDGHKKALADESTSA